MAHAVQQRDGTNEDSGLRRLLNNSKMGGKKVRFIVRLVEGILAFGQKLTSLCVLFKILID